MNPLQVLTPRGHTFLWLGIVALLCGMGLGYPDVTRIGLALALLPVAMLIVSRRRTPSLAVSRTVEPSRLEAGQNAAVLATFTNVGRRRTSPYLATETLPRALGASPRFLLPSLTVGAEYTVRYPVHGHLRGSYQVGPLGLRHRDAVGLTYVAVRLSSTSEVIVLPRLLPVGGDAGLPASQGEEGDRPLMSALHGEDDASIRTYRHGDELRRVHWPATANRGELMVRQEDRPAQRRAVLIIDTRAEAYAGSHPEVFEYAVSAAASIAHHLVANGFTLHLVSPTSVRNGRAAASIDINEAMDSLARLTLERKVGLEQTMSGAHALTAGGCLSVAIVFAYDRADLAKLAQVRASGHEGRALVLDPHSQALRPSEDGPAAPLLHSGWKVSTAGPDIPLSRSWSLLGGKR